jgi:hypothetical protein
VTPLDDAPGPAAASHRARAGRTLAFVESPVQLLNLLEWAHARAVGGTAPPAAPPPPEPHTGTAETPSAGLTIIVLPPNDPVTRGQLRRMVALARGEGHPVEWAQARDGTVASLRTLASLARPLRRAGRIVIGDPFSRYVQTLLSLTRRGAEVTVVDDGTATMEFVSQLARGERRFVRWHRKRDRGARSLLFAPVSAAARRRLTPADRRRVEVFSSMPVEPPEHVTVTANDFAWTRDRFGPPGLTRGTDLVGTSLVETGVVDAERYLAAVVSLTRAHGVTRYFAHRRESAEKLRRVAAEAGLEVIRPDLPLELVARRGPIGRTILSFPSTVVHTLPLALTGTEVRVVVCDVDPAWLTKSAAPRAQGFLSSVTGSARDVRRLPSSPTTPDHPPHEGKVHTQLTMDVCTPHRIKFSPVWTNFA